MTGPTPERSEQFDWPEQVPLLPIRDLVVFPFMIVPLIVSREISIRAIEEALASSRDRLVFLVTQKEAATDAPVPEDLHEIGSVGMIMRMSKLNDGRAKVVVQGLVKARVQRFVQTTPSFSVVPEAAENMPLRLDADAKLELEALVRASKENLDHYIDIAQNIPKEVMLIVGPVDEPGRLADLIASNLSLDVDEAQRLLATLDPRERLVRVNEQLEREVDILTMQQKIQAQARQEMSRTQREYFLREQLRAIRTELGDSDAKDDELEEIRRRIGEAGMPEAAEKEGRRQLDRLGHLPLESAEAAVVRNYLDWLVELPWSQQSDDNRDLDAAYRVLEADHYGLASVKERIIEHLAVHKLKRDMRGPILCFVGPPGVGKTSLGRSIARAMGRRFTQTTLGGLRDEAEIVGHRRTYVGAMPGCILQGLKRAGTRNPLFMLDEIDKMGADARGDPASALLSVLDPSQNHEFVDHLLNLAFDLSNVLFIATANVVETIPGPLRDRMEIIRIGGYSEEEKLQIVRRHILPRQLDAHGLTPEHIQLANHAIGEIIRAYTREAGVRELERRIGAVCRKVARKVASGKRTRTRITRQRLRAFLGHAPPPRQPRPELDEIGVATGLAWTQAGGEILLIEVSAMRGRGALQLTGQLGEVMKESAHAALSYLRARADRYGIDQKYFDEHELHVHVPEGAIPKDGPSAGIAIAAAIASVILRRPVSRDFAVTGEITLRGRLLPVGGIKEKVLAAARAGVRCIVLPADNAVDVEELTASVRRRLRITYCKRVDEVFRCVLIGGELPEPPGAEPTWRATVAASQTGAI